MISRLRKGRSLTDDSSWNDIEGNFRALTKCYEIVEAISEPNVWFFERILGIKYTQDQYFNSCFGEFLFNKHFLFLFPPLFHVLYLLLPRQVGIFFLCNEIMEVFGLVITELLRSDILLEIIDGIPLTKIEKQASQGFPWCSNGVIVWSKSMI